MAQTPKRQYSESEVTEIFNLRIRNSCLLFKEIYFQLGVIHIDGKLRCFNSIEFVCSMAFLSNNDRSKIVIVSQFHEVWLFMILLKLFGKYSKSIVILKILKKLKFSENFEFF